MIGQRINNKPRGFALPVMIALSIWACQPLSVDATKPAIAVVGDSNSVVPDGVILPKNKTLETLQSEARRVIE